MENQMGFHKVLLIIAMQKQRVLALNLQQLLNTST